MIRERKGMEKITDSSHAFLFFTMVFVLCGTVHVFLADVHFFRCSSQLLFGALTIGYTFYLFKHMTDKRITGLMILISRLMVLYFMLQIGKYMLFLGFPVMQRYAWYGYFIPMILIPLLIFFLALSLYRPEEEPLEKKWKALLIPAFIMILITLTNDYHCMVFSFPYGKLVYYSYIRSWFYWVIFAWCVLLALASFLVLFKKCSFRKDGFKRWYPLIFELAGILIFILYMLDLIPKFRGIRLWDIGELFGFVVLGFLDICCKVGMIPTNVGYDLIFAESDTPAVISDSEGNLIYKSKNVTGQLKADEDTRIMTHAIRGGSVSWAVDLSEMHKIRRQIDETTYQIRHRNEYLINENRLKQEQSELEMRNKVYDRITSIVKPQLDVIEGILDAEGEEFDSKLTKVAVLNAYIKRRSNMELINLPGDAAHDKSSGMIPFRELTTAITESAEYIRLGGYDVAVSFNGDGDLPAGMVTSTYEFFEYIVETCLDTLSDLAVFIRLKDESLNMRMMFQAYDFTYDQCAAYGNPVQWNGRVQITKEKNDVVVSLTMDREVSIS